MSDASGAGRPTLWNYVHNVFYMIISGAVLHFFDVWNVMWRSQRIYRSVLYASLASHSVFVLIGLYLSFVVNRTNKNWTVTHQGYIQVATAAVVLGGLLWAVALFPVFHFWILPLGLAAMVFSVTLVTMIPSPKGKID